MTHSHDRTLLAKLGFADPDRKEPLHDIACSYLVTPEAVKGVIKVLDIEYTYRDHKGENGNDKAYICKEAYRVESIRMCNEREIYKGDGRYRTTIGFMDVAYELSMAGHRTNVMVEKSHGKWQSERDSMWHEREYVCIEVKTSAVPMGDIVRQMACYRTYAEYGFKHWVLATTYEMTQSQVGHLTSRGIKHVRLGEKFNQFVIAYNTSDKSNSPEI